MKVRDPQGHPVDLVPSGLPPTEQLPFALRVDEEQAGARLNEAIYRVSGDSGGHVDATRAPGTVSFEYQDASGLHVRKDFRFDPSNYIVAFSASATSGDRSLNPTVVWGPGLGDVAPGAGGGGSFFSGSTFIAPAAILHRAGKVERIALGSIAEQPAQEGQFRFAGVEDLYFIAAVINPGQSRMEYRPVVVPGPENTQRQFISQAFGSRSRR